VNGWVPGCIPPPCRLHVSPSSSSLFDSLKFFSQGERRKGFVSVELASIMEGDRTEK